MPLYEYQCENGHRFEKIRKFSDPPVETCPTCSAPVRKLMSSPAIQFKGSGWYITDYARKDAPAGAKPEGEKAEKGEKGEKGEKADKAAAEAKSDAAASTSSKSETKTETKPSAKSETNA